MSISLSYTRALAGGIAILGLTIAALPADAAAGDPTGVWLDNTGRGAVEISNCGKGLCGKVVWVASAKDKDGCGEQIIGNVRPVGPGRWDNGWIYNPADGRKYDVELKPLSGDRLRVMGYAGMKLFSETYVWKRAPADLQRCDGVQQAAAAPEPAPAATSERSATATAQPPAGETQVETLSATTAREGTGAKLIETPDRTAAAPAPAPEAEPYAAKSHENAPRARAPSIGNLKVGGLALDKIVKRTKGGNCQANLYGFRVTFDCSKF